MKERQPGCRVTTFAVVWIEIISVRLPPAIYPVTTFAVVWIEITRFMYCAL